MKETFNFAQASERTGISESVIILYVEREWISPAEPQRLDEEDLARALLIRDLEALGVNPEAVPLILHLLDQLYFLRARLRKA